MKLHPSVTRFIEEYERQAALTGSIRKTIDRTGRLFLQNVWGPAMNWNFDGLKAEYPFKDLKGGQRFADFVFIRNGILLLIELDGFTTHARDISPGDFDDHLLRQNSLVLTGWLILRFSFNQVERQPELCQGQLKQAIGHWWSVTQGNPSARTGDIWNQRSNLVTQLAVRRNGTIKPADLATEFGISRRSASAWMKRFSADGTFLPVRHQTRNTAYVLAHIATLDQQLD